MFNNQVHGGWIGLVVAPLLISGCAIKNQEVEVVKPKVESVSNILVRIQNTTGEKYALSTKDLDLQINETMTINSFVDLQDTLGRKGFIVEVVSNKYRLDVPKIVEISERGKYVGSLSTMPYEPLKEKYLNDVLIDLGLVTKYSIIMDEDVMAESKHLEMPSKIFNGKTAAEFLRFVEKAYDYHVIIDQQSATINIRKYKSVIINIIAEKDKILKDSQIFLEASMDGKKVKQFAADNGKIFISGTPSAIDKTENYANEINAINANKIVVSFDGVKKITELLAEISATKKMQMFYTVESGDFTPSKDTGKWFDSLEEIDEYLRKNYNKKIITTRESDENRDGIKDTFSLVIKDVNGINISTPTTVSSFFKKLSAVDGLEYIVDGDANIPVSNAIIDDFNHMRTYMWSAAAIKLTMTDPGAGLPKIIKVEQKQSW